MVQAIPSGMEGLIPHLVVDGAAEAIEFYKKAFGAEEIMRVPSMDGRKIMHAEIKINGQPVFFADDFPEFSETGTKRAPSALGTSTVTIHRFVEDCDAAVKRAVDAGATVAMPPEDAFWGDRYAIVVDPYGHHWSIATHQKDLTPEEITDAMKAAFS